MTAQQLTPLDMAFLCLERETTPMHMGAVTVFQPETPVDAGELVDTLIRRASRLPSLRKIIRHTWFPLGSCFWTEAADFDPARHVITHEVFGGGHSELANLASRIIAEPLDLTRPLWELHVITGLQDGRFALLAKFHHALCDGSGAIQLGIGLLDGFATAEPPAEPDTSELPTPLDTARSAWRVLSSRERLLDKATELAVGLPGFLRDTNRRLDIASAIARNTRLPQPNSPLLAAPGTARRVELLRLDLADVHRARKRHGGTVNDVLLAVVTGALRRWLTARGFPIDDLELRALIPVSRRVREQNEDGGNKLSGHLCHLPVGEPDLTARVQRIQDCMHHNKTVGLSRGPGAIPLLAGGLPHAAHRVAMPIAGIAAPLLFDTVVTNVPIPRLRLSLAGARLREMYPFVPLAPGHTVGVALSRYEDSVHVGIQVNSEALADIEKLSEAVPSALSELTGLAS